MPRSDKHAVENVIRLILLCVAGAVVGGLFGGSVLLSQLYLYDHGYGETEKCMFIGAVLGMAAAVVLHSLMRLSDGRLNDVEEGDAHDVVENPRQ